MLDTTNSSTTSNPAKILTDRRLQKPATLADQVKAAAAAEGIGAGKIFAEVLKTSLSRKNKLKPGEYFAYGVYRKDLTKEQKAEFIGEDANFKLNLRLSPPGITEMRGFLRDKLAHAALWRQYGLPTTETQAFFSPNRWVGDTRVLRDAEAIAAFLTQDARMPLFGKPVNGLQALGSVRIDSVDADTGQACLADGRVVSVRDLADEIIRDFPAGYLFQSVVPQNADVSAHIGPMLSCPRLVTVIQDEQPEMLYAYWKIAAPDAVADNFWQKGSMLARINAKTGVVENCITGKGPEKQFIETHPVTGQPIVGYQIPHWEEAVELVCKAHSIFPINGCLGWDVGFGEDGPVLIECNENSGHDTYQFVLDKGLMRPEMKAVFDKVIARNERIFKDLKARRYEVDF